MLVISRRVGESFRIGDSIEVTILKISGSRIIVGIEAPANVSVDRGEVSAIMHENRKAANKNNWNKNFSELYQTQYNKR